MRTSVIKIKEKLDKLDLNEDNSVVIGSGIMNALGLRASADIDVVVDDQTYRRLLAGGAFSRERVRGKELLTDDIFEIGTSWPVIEKDWNYSSLLSVSTVIGGVRYITAEFLLDAKRSWLQGDHVREKDINDVRLLERYCDQRNEST